MRLKDHVSMCDDLPTVAQPKIGKILVTGAGGYIGGRLIPELSSRGYRVRAMVRRAISAEQREKWHDVEIVEADALDRRSLKGALEGIHTAYYLIHSLLLGKDKFESTDVRAAINFRKTAEEMSIQRIIYLGGLGDIKVTLSPHLRSRMKVAEELRRGKVSTTILRAAVIIGCGSASYEILKHLVLHLPVWFMPVWARTKCQPISVRDVIKYLVGVLELPETAGKYFDIGGDDILTYETMLKVFAACLCKRRLVLSVPFSNVSIFAYWASLFTPVPAPITRCLFESIGNEVICKDDQIRRFLPFQPMTYKEAIIKSFLCEEQGMMCTHCSGPFPNANKLTVKFQDNEETVQYTSLQRIKI